MDNSTVPGLQTGLLTMILLLVLGAGCPIKPADDPKVVSTIDTMERVTFTTSDGVEIVGLYQSGGEKFAILLHQMPFTKESWDAFMEKLAEAGYSGLAIDERGHGESTMNGTLDYKMFSEAEQQAKIHDVEAAFKYLNGKGATEENTIVIGASIGANLAIQFLQEHPSMRVAVALSPGLNYRGVTTDDKIQSLASGQSVILAASDNDEQSNEDTKKLHAMNHNQTVLLERSGIGHGTNMTDAEPDLIDEIIALLP